MGTYLYEQTSKQFKVVWPDFGVLTVNEVKYYCKPYWDLWGGFTPYSDWEKKVAAAYKRKQTNADKRVPNQYLAQDNEDGTYTVWKWQDDIRNPPIIFSDDDNFGTNLKSIGKMVKRGRSWLLEEVHHETPDR